MSVTLASFRAFFHEFIDAEDALIEQHIEDAIVTTPADVFGSLTDIVTKWRAADSLACSPWGRHARLTDDSTKSIYGKKVEEYLKMAPLAGPWVPGVCTGRNRNLGIGLERGDT